MNLLPRAWTPWDSPLFDGMLSKLPDGVGRSSHSTQLLDTRQAAFGSGDDPSRRALAGFRCPGPVGRERRSHRTISADARRLRMKLHSPEFERQLRRRIRPARQAGGSEARKARRTLHSEEKNGYPSRQFISLCYSPSRFSRFRRKPFCRGMVSAGGRRAFWHLPDVVDGPGGSDFALVGALFIEGCCAGQFAGCR